MVFSLTREGPLGEGGVVWPKSKCTLIDALASLERDVKVIGNTIFKTADIDFEESTLQLYKPTT